LTTAAEQVQSSPPGWQAAAVAEIIKRSLAPKVFGSALFECETGPDLFANAGNDQDGFAKLKIRE
jgi:hypothetical protein